MKKRSLHTLFFQKRKLTLGQRAADELTRIAGSWWFILVLSSALVAWMVLNTVLVVVKRYDPYPFILLNLFLSSLAAYQAPVILMSQNRAAERDRHKAELDYQVNRRAEHEVVNVQKELDEIKRLVRKVLDKKRQ